MTNGVREVSSEPEPDEDEEERLREESDRIEQLLGELTTSAGPQTRQRVEELMRRTVALYGAALERILDYLRGACVLDAEVEAQLCSDHLVSSLLLLHGLHPTPTETRVQGALAEVAPRVGVDPADLTLVQLEAGIVRLRVGSGRCSVSRATLQRALERAVHETAPEVTRLELEGVEDAAEDLVTIDLGRSKRTKR